MGRVNVLATSCLLALCALSAAKPANAACTASVTALNFGDINPAVPGVRDVTATVSYTCSSLVSILSRLNVCIEIGLGPSDSSVTDRRLVHTTMPAEGLGYNVYSDPARTRIFGNVYGSANPPVIVQYGPYALALVVTERGTQTVYGRIPVNSSITQRNVGQYASALTVTVRMDVLNAADLLPCVDILPAVVSMPVNAQLLSACQITATPLDFGRQPSNFSSAIQSTSQINSTCTKGTAYQIGLNNGLYASGNQRRMRSANGQYINYELYKNAERTQRWGMALNTPETVTGQATGSSQSTTVYGQVIPQSGLRAADYKDTVTVTITY